jgi:hypothetical protein
MNGINSSILYILFILSILRSFVPFYTGAGVRSANCPFQ